MREPRGPTPTPTPRLPKFSVNPGAIFLRRWNRQPIAWREYNSGMATVLVDAENVRRSLWPNIPRDELEELCARWAEQRGHDVLVVWEGVDTADDRIAREVAELDAPVWVVTSDRELRNRVETHAERVLGGGSFARELRAG
jgi:hypothetical protein